MAKPDWTKNNIKEIYKKGEKGESMRNNYLSKLIAMMLAVLMILSIVPFNIKAEGFVS